MTVESLRLLEVGGDGCPGDNNGKGTDLLAGAGSGAGVGAANAAGGGVLVRAGEGSVATVFKPARICWT